MATLAELQDALVNADRAGDKEAARQLADAIVSMQQTPPSNAPKMSKSERFWMGLAGCRQALNNLEGAIDAYSMAGVVQAMDNPEPFLLAGMCYIKMGERQKAIDVLNGAVVLGDTNNPQHMACREKIEHLLKMLRQHTA